MTKVIAYVPLNQKGNGVLTYQGPDDATTQAQYNLISAGQAGTNGALNGVVCRYWALYNPGSIDASGNVGGTKSVFGGNIGGNVQQAAIGANLGVPPAAAAASVLAATALTAAVQNITVGITNPLVARVLSVVGNAAGIAGNVTITGTDMSGGTITDVIALNGATTVNGVKAFAKVTEIDLPIQTHGGTDTVSVGVSAILGLPFRMDHNAVLRATFGTTPEVTAPAVTFDATNISGNTVHLNSAVDGAHQVIIDAIRVDAPIDAV